MGAVVAPDAAPMRTPVPVEASHARWVAAAGVAAVLFLAAATALLVRGGVAIGDPVDPAVEEALDAYEIGASELAVADWLAPAFAGAPRPNAEYTTISGIRVLAFDDVEQVLEVTLGAVEAGRPSDPAVLDAVVVDDGWSLMGIDRFVVAYRQDDLEHLAVVIAALADHGRS